MLQRSAGSCRHRGGTSLGDFARRLLARTAPWGFPRGLLSRTSPGEGALSAEDPSRPFVRPSVRPAVLPGVCAPCSAPLGLLD